MPKGAVSRKQRAESRKQKKGENMKKILIGFLIVLAMFASVHASPFLVCDEYPTTVTQPTYFEIVMDGGTPVQSPPQALTGGGKRLYYDVGTISTGNHTMSVKACNEWGCSVSSPFVFTKAVPGAPVGIKFEK